MKRIKINDSIKIKKKPKNSKRKKKTRIRYDRILGLLLIIALLSAGLILVITTATQKNTTSKNLSTKLHTSTPSSSKSQAVSFLSVGDNLIHGMVYYAAANQAQTPGDYNFAPFYTETKSEIEQADISFINQETPFAGPEIGGLSSYPTFNGPTQILEGLESSGFDWINMANNHADDRGEEGIQAELAHLSQTDLLETGVNLSREDQDKVKTLKKKGITFSFNSFTYGLNGLVLPQEQDYLINQTDKDLIKKEVTAMNQASDVQIVNMHWGTENSTAVDDQQREYAQYLADLGVDVIVAEHPHVIQPVEWVTSKSGQKVLVIYSMGNFLSAQDDNINMLGLGVEWSVKLDQGKVSIQDVKILPTVTLINGPWNSTQGATFSVKFLKDYTDTDAAEHTLTSLGIDMSRQYFVNQVKEIIGSPPNMKVLM